jgi:hypothetical protein
MLIPFTRGIISAAVKQTPALKAPPTYEQVIVRDWKDVHNKILARRTQPSMPAVTSRHRRSSAGSNTRANSTASW